MSKTPFSAIVLAAGQGTRMKSKLPKVLHSVAGKPIVTWPVNAALNAGATRVVVVVGHLADSVKATLAAHFNTNVETALQAEQRGTGDAVRCGLSPLKGASGYVVILNGDIPLLPTAAVTALIESATAAKKPLSMLTGIIPDATGYGRMIRDASGNVVGVREHRDCSAEELQIREMNPGVYCAEISFLEKSLATLRPQNAQNELYLTDIVSAAAKEGGVAAIPWSMDDLHGINDRFELSQVDRAMRLRIAEKHARGGVTIRDPQRTSIDADVEIAADVTLEPNVTLRGKTKIGEGAFVDVGCVLEDVLVLAGARIKPYTVATQSEIGERAQVGPFSHLRPKSKLGPDVHMGNFVETKETVFGARSKASHLSYLGNGVIGEDVNVGAGTIFCNYDGYQKHTTTLEDGVFIGSDSQIVAPVRVGKGAYVATSTTVTKDVPADALAISRVKQENKEGYARKLRGTMQARKDAAKKGSAT